MTPITEPQYAIDDIALEYNAEPVVNIFVPQFFEVGNVLTCATPPVGNQVCVPANKYTVIASLGDEATAQAYVNAKAAAELHALTHFKQFFRNILISIPLNAVVSATTISASGLIGTVSKVVLVLNQLNIFDTTTFVYLLLQSPSGQVCEPFGSGGCTNTASAVVLTLDDAALTQMPVCPSGTPLSTGTFRPNSDNPSASLNSPAPAGPYSIPLSTLNGSTPNGVWTLYATSFTTVNHPTLGNGFSLQITTV